MHQVEASDVSVQAIPPAVQSRLLRLPPLSHTAARLHMVNQEDADIGEMAALITKDPALSAAILRLVNSSLFGVRHTVRGIQHALALLGLDRMRALATTAALRMLVTPASASPALTRCWRHSVACALATHEKAANANMDGDTAYTAGLLHDIGRFAMLSCWPAEYSQLLATCDPAQLLDQELATLRVRHTDAGAFLLQHWGLPASLIEVAREHHCQPGDPQPRLVSMVSCACRTADALGFTVTAKSSLEPVEDDSQPCTIPDIDPLRLRIADGINQLECL